MSPVARLKSGLVLKPSRSYSKIGLNEVVGLSSALRYAMAPLVDLIASKTHWTDASTLLDEVEYTSRDGFWAHSHNCGGLSIDVTIPECEKDEWDFLEFGECDECGKESDTKGNALQCGYEGQECALANEGHLSAHLRIWLKFEGFEGGSNGMMQFYLVASGGNNDAPYFREKHMPTLFETSFRARTLQSAERQALAAVRKMIRSFKGDSK